MKFFYKLFLCTTAIITVALTTMICLTLSLTLRSSVQQSIESALSQHRLLEYAMECSILNVSNSGTFNQQTLSELAEQSASLLTNGERYALVTAEGETVSGTVPVSLRESIPDTQEIQYRIQSRGSRHDLVIISRFSQSGADLLLYTVRDITFSFHHAEHLLQQERIIFLSVMAGSSLVMLLVVWFLTRPIQALNQAAQAFSAGDYTSRAHLNTGDEFQLLADTYNQLAETLEQKISDLELAGRQKEDFVANFAHELKTPITSIIGYGEMIYQNKLDGIGQRKAAEYIVSEGMRLESLSFKLMDLIALNRTEFLLEETRLSLFFQDVRAAIQPAAEKRGIALTMDWEDGWVRMELDLFKTLILNLLDNALKSGAAAVSLVGQVQCPDYLISVSDNGRGIPEEELSRITEAFYMVDKSRSRKEHGAGLGLALCARIAELHHTRLEYESRPGQGTTVRLRMRLEAADET
jgi:signal transduction histidine kinase